MTSQLDPTIIKVLDQKPPAGNVNESEDEDELFKKLEEDTAALDGLREQRMQQLHEELEKARHLRNLGHGTYETAESEKEVMDITTQTKYSIVHFAHQDFHRCAIMDRHLRELAPRHYEARFVKMSVHAAPFLVEKLSIRVLPCVIAFVDGKTVGRIEGFQLLGNTDSFTTATLERCLVNFGVLEREKLGEKESASGSGVPKQEAESDDDWE